jgi:hypothetical protein
LDGVAMEILEYLFYGHLVYFVVIWYIFTRFGFFGARKIWQPCGEAVGKFQSSENIEQLQFEKS